jgi:hypothetical protein
VSVIQPVEMVEIRFMNERVSPTGPEKKREISGAASGKIPIAIKNPYSHGVHENAK